MVECTQFQGGAGRAGAQGARRGFNEFNEDAVRVAVRKSPRGADAPPIPVLKGGNGLRLGVSLDSSATLLDFKTTRWPIAPEQGRYQKRRTLSDSPFLC